ncbi:type VI secretion system-associated FHA domain protein TagH [Simiduia aestuariiviva]|uniref:Type VI secretion system FHA domain protein n=1 Tax=Simiduia aestuariiviva TaxID=1510459 RepID=A0A839UTF7_9GAMM|nr:type VI secretion system-associated FHA domain protein TagH [Simiduia aestuariiviva]MBB3168788.1 type VI secretion system FHA domain protein [Simiduia aestuariiviva]
MDLILTVIADPNGTNMINHTKAFEKSGGSLGRSDQNDWVLPDPERIISSQHCRVDYTAGQYTLTDTSTNGVFVNESASAIGNGNVHNLADGDIVGLGEYKLRISLRAPAKPSTKLPDGLDAVDFLDESDKTTFSASMAPQLAAQAQAQKFDDFLEAKPINTAQSKSDWGSASEHDVQADLNINKNTDPLSIFDSVLDSPAPSFGAATAHNSIEEDWWKDGSTADNAAPLAHSYQAPAVTPQPPSEPLPPRDASSAIPNPMQSQHNPFAASAAVLQGGELNTSPPQHMMNQQFSSAPTTMASASIASNQTTTNHTRASAPLPNAAQEFGQTSSPAIVNTSIAGGQSLKDALGLKSISPAKANSLLTEVADIVKQTTHRLIDLLRARNSIKNELRVQRTMIQTADNNPLKFSATADDALNSMFANNSSAFMSPVEAIQDSFDDLSDHQVAVLAGMRAAYDAMFKHFSPSSLESRFNQSGSLLNSKHAKNWASYCDHYQSLTRDRESTYEDLFGEEFAAAYEKQLTDLKNARALSRRNKV